MNIRLRTWGVVVTSIIGLVLLCSCKDKKLGTPKGSCNSDHASNISSRGCWDYTVGDKFEHESNCRAMQGTYSSAPCDRTGAIAGCLEKGSSYKEVGWYYSANPMNSSKAKASKRCSEGRGTPYDTNGDPIPQ